MIHDPQTILIPVFRIRRNLACVPFALAFRCLDNVSGRSRPTDAAGLFPISAVNRIPLLDTGCSVELQPLKLPALGSSHLVRNSMASVLECAERLAIGPFCIESPPHDLCPSPANGWLDSSCGSHMRCHYAP